MGKEGKLLSRQEDHAQTGRNSNCIRQQAEAESGRLPALSCMQIGTTFRKNPSQNDVFFVNTQRSGILNFVKTQRGGILRESELVQHARTHTTKKQSKRPILIPHGSKDSTAKPFDFDEFGDDLWDAAENEGQKQKKSDDVQNAVTAAKAGLISRNVKRDSLDGLPEVF